MKRIAILQSNYIPWKGYFDIINSVDEFIIYDDAQYTVRDWRNRNIIKTKNGLKWLTIPVLVKNRRYQKINETRIADNKWASKHWESIKHSYSSSPFFDDYNDIFEKAYQECKELDFLSDVNRFFLEIINSILGIGTTISDSSLYVIEGDRNQKIISICKQAGADVYLSGPSAKNYVEEEIFEKAGIKLCWADYKDYPEYCQKYPPFEHNVSILDLILNEGEKVSLFMKSF